MSYASKLFLAVAYRSLQFTLIWFILAVDFRLQTYLYLYLTSWCTFIFVVQFYCLQTHLKPFEDVAASQFPNDFKELCYLLSCKSLAESELYRCQQHHAKLHRFSHSCILLPRKIKGVLQFRWSAIVSALHHEVYLFASSSLEAARWHPLWLLLILCPRLF